MILTISQTSLGPIRNGTAQAHIFVEKDLSVLPPDRNDVDIAVAINVYGDGAIMMFITNMQNMLTPLSTATVDIFK